MDSLRPVLEEQPKWSLLADILEEIERDVYFNPVTQDGSNGTILVMCSDQNTARQLREYLQTMHVQQEQVNGTDKPEEAERKPSAMFMMRRKLRNYLKWKKDFAHVSASLFNENQKALEGFTDPKAAGYRGKAPPNKRRRIRGGSSSATSSGRPANRPLQVAEDKEAQVANLLADIGDADYGLPKEDAADSLDDIEDFFELQEMGDLVVIHPYDGDMDEHVLEEVRPRYIIMYEPDAAFIRRVEVYRSSHSDRNVRVYFLYYAESVEERAYLSSVRKEKDAFTRLIKEKGVSNKFGLALLFRSPANTVSEHGSYSYSRSLLDRPARVISSYGQYAHCGRWPSCSNSRTSSCGCRRARVSLVPPISTPWS